MDRRKALEPGSILEFGDEQNTAVYTVGQEIGRGSSCIVYDAFYTANNGDTKPARIKEYYPFKLRILRKEDGNLEISDVDAELFLQEKNSFEQAFVRQNYLFTVQGLTNSISTSIDIYHKNNTAYTVSTFSEGQTLENRKPDNLQDAVKVVMTVAKVVGRIHDTGYLYLDIKPDNIFVFPETWELVQLFDFDSLIDRSKPIKNQRISYSRGFAALEQKRGDSDSIGPHTDVFGIGALLFWLLYDRCPGPFDGNINASFSFNDIVYKNSTFRDRLYFELTDFFHKTLASYYADRYENMNMALDELARILPLADSKADFICSYRIPDQPLFTGRNRELDSLHKLLTSEGAAVSVCGMGGIGKSSLVIQYLTIHRKEYDSIIYIDHQDSVKKIILSDMHLKISTVRKMDFETNDEYYLRKIAKLKEIAEQQKILIVLDNYYSRAGDDFTDFFAIPWKAIIVTREIDNVLELPQIRVNELETEDEQICLFEKYLGRHLLSNERMTIADLLHKINGHTLTLKLLAKHLGAGLMSINDINIFVEKHRLDRIPGILAQVKGLKVYQGKINQLLTDLLNMNKLTGPEKTIMKQLGAFKMPGISAEDFCEFTSAGAAHDQTLALSLGPVHEQREHIDGLVRKGWVEQYGKYLMLHPIIGDIVMAWNWTAEYRTAEQAMMLKLAEIIRDDYKTFQNLQNEMNEAVETGFKGHKAVGSDRIGEYISLAEQSLDWYPFSDKSSQKLKFQMIRVLPQSEEDKVLKQSKDLLAKGKNLDPEELIDLHYQIAYIYEQQNKMAASYREIKKASVLVSKVTDPLIKADHYFWLAGGAKENGDFEKAMNLLYQAEETAYNAGTDQGMQKYALYLTRDIHWLLEKVDISSLREEDIEGVLTEISYIIDEYHVTDIDTISSYYMQLCKHQCYAGIDDQIVLETMEKGAAAMQRLSTSDYFYIDNVILFKFDVYQALLMYDEARKVLEEGVELCNRYADMLPYIRKKLDLLLDLACVYYNIRQPSMAKKYYDQIAEILENTDGLRMSQEFISDYETYRL